jgi:hypothetical protein
MTNARTILMHRLKVSLSLTGLILLCTALIAAPQTSARCCTIYFYSSETNINNFSSLKAQFDKYLLKHGNYTFQPFSDRETFEGYVNKVDGVFLISSWHYARLEQNAALEPMLVGARGDHSIQKRVLSAKTKLAAPSALHGYKIASASNEKYTRDMLRDMLGPDQNDLLNSFKILVVPKDIDALMAVSFGMAKAAITTDNSLGKFERINPKQFRSLHQLAAGNAALLPIVIAPKKRDEDVTGLLAVIEEMGATIEGGRNLKLLGLDTLRWLNDEQKRSLQP